MKKLAVFAVAAVLAASAFAQNAEWIGNSSISYNGTSVESSAFDGLNLGSISALLLGGSIESYGDDDGEHNPAYLNYQIDTTSPEQIELAWTTYDGANNHFTGTGSVNISAYADDGQTHNINVYFSKPTQHENWQSDDPPRNIWNGQVYEATADHDYTATFQATSAVPEPATMSLLGLGALAMVLRRKLRK